MIVLLLILIVAVFLVRQFPEHPTLRPAAIALGVITAIQVMLGFTTFMMLILFPETSLAVVDHQRPARHHRGAHFRRRLWRSPS